MLVSLVGAELGNFVLYVLLRIVFGFAFGVFAFIQVYFRLLSSYNRPSSGAESPASAHRE